MAKPQFSLSSVLLVTALVAVCTALWAADPSWQAGLLQLPVLIAVPALIAVLAGNLKGYDRTFFLGMLTVMLIAAMIQCQVLYDLANFSFPPTYSIVQGFGVAGPPREIVSHWHEVQRVLAQMSGQIHGTLVLWLIAVLAGTLARIIHEVVAASRRRWLSDAEAARWVSRWRCADNAPFPPVQKRGTGRPA